MKLYFLLLVCLLAGCVVPNSRVVIDARENPLDNPAISKVRMNPDGACPAESVQLMSQDKMFQMMASWRNPAVDYTFDEGYIDPKVISLANVVYPPAMLNQGVDGTVMVLLLLDQNGRVHSARPVCATRIEFVASAVAAAKKMKYQPSNIDGKPENDTALLPIDFIAPGR